MAQAYTFLPLPAEVTSVAVWCDATGKLTQAHSVVGFSVDPDNGHGQALICTTRGNVVPIGQYRTPDLFCGLMAPSVAAQTTQFTPI